MKEWVVVASRAEAKIFQRDHKAQSLRWIKTLNNKKGRRRERDFESDKHGTSYAKFSGGTSPHRLENQNTHIEIVANHFAQTIGKILLVAHGDGCFKKATIFSDPKFLGKIKREMQFPLKNETFSFVEKNIEKASVAEIQSHIE